MNVIARLSLSIMFAQQQCLLMLFDYYRIKVLNQLNYSFRQRGKSALHIEAQVCRENQSLASPEVSYYANLIFPFSTSSPQVSCN